MSAASETCQSCPRGFFKDNSIVFSSCLACPSGLTTEKVNSTSIDSCSISKCIRFSCFWGGGGMLRSSASLKHCYFKKNQTTIDSCSISGCIRFCSFWGYSSMSPESRYMCSGLFTNVDKISFFKRVFI